ncbi:Rv3235 family protein [Microbacterium sp. STN6]|uniref:Rv3235 family protein n=1 Tax=Microbacterium sp. STN6 TaxID=2995588 RepID=UPI002260BAAE|nr:Rv3235 family protein [Microbacterium sp. STN6]MCX7521091.1 Rv3235 family protein [Microbacterium sp. STN6]
MSPAVPVAAEERDDDARGTPAAGQVRQSRGSAAAAAAAARFDADEYFGAQRTPVHELPDPQPLLENLSRCVIEVLAGVRELDQLSRWVSDEVYRHLLKRVVLAARARQVKGVAARRPQVSIGRTIISMPREDVVEAVVMVHNRARSRAVAIRLEGIDRRWRASVVSVL